LFFQQIRDAEERADKIYEAVIGVVVDNKDDKKLARVKVKFPSLPGDDTSKWAPIVSLGAGKDRGWFFLPEIDDEVLVMFEHGDFNRPIVIASIWNGKDKPADKNDGGNERRMFASREGSKIVLDDDQGTVTVEDGKGDGKITISKDNKITIESSSGDVCAQAPSGDLVVVANEIMLDASTNLKIEAATDCKVSSDGKITVDGGSLLKANGATVKFMCSSASDAEEGTDTCEDVPDPVGG
jgi:uncharacterized protein involved in type VI secretion and phage assembly